MYESLVALYEVLMGNPISRAAIFGLIRNATGFIQSKWAEKTGKPYDVKILAGTIIKYEVAINAVEQLAPEVGLPVGLVGPIVLVCDIIQSWARKILGK